ncbi:hypothetical protein [Epibacterium ulvae]|uniref:hypothetical protein n=1 Tax=Epibacterium ulvae TaxID=1156985 RepID=UPI0024903700|nr:hypothetical protein [Epibacterium ulvae]
MTMPDLKADCSQCAALCCVAYPFDASEEFAIVKETDTPCPNLADDFRCSIHADLTCKGFGGCVAYSCAGAGQRITQELFDGETWRDDPDLLPHMTYALRIIRPIHEALLILKEARTLPLSAEYVRRCDALIQALCPQDATSIWDFEEAEVQDALAAVPEFIPELAPFVPRSD